MMSVGGVSVRKAVPVRSFSSPDTSVSGLKLLLITWPGGAGVHEIHASGWGVGMSDSKRYVYLTGCIYTVYIHVYIQGVYIHGKIHV